MEERLSILQDIFQSLSLRYHRYVLDENPCTEKEELIAVICKVLDEIRLLKRELARI